MRLIVVILSLSLASSAFAADDKLFTPVYETALTSEAPNGDMFWGPNFKSVSRVSFNADALISSRDRTSRKNSSAAEDVQPLMAASAIEFVVDFNTYTAVLDHIEDRGGGNFSWFGRVEGSQFLSHFAVVNGKMAGEIWLPFFSVDGFHRSLISRGGDTFLVQMDDNVLGKSMDNDQLSPEFFSRETLDAMTSIKEAGGTLRPILPWHCRPEEIPTREVDELQVYDNTSLSWFSRNPWYGSGLGAKDELHVLVQSTFDSKNSHFTNSKVGGSNRVNLVALVGFDYSSAGNTQADLSKLIESPEVAALRDLYHADIVGLWVGFASTGFSGMGTGFDLTGRLAHYVVYVGGGAKTAVHEFGHVIGMDHQPENATGLSRYPFSYGHFIAGIFRDAVSTYLPQCGDSCSVGPFFSNPSVLFNGIPTGIVDKRENWRMVGIAFPETSHFRISGNETSCLAVRN